jgi:2-oxoglutarate ferredoxin oxidoreductase subunit alpha
MQTVALPSLEAIEVYREPLFAGTEGGGATSFQRYAPAADGKASIRSIPGTAGGMYRTGGLEHDATGQPGFELELRVQNVERRTARMKAIELALSNSTSVEQPVVGSDPVGVVSWGSSADATREAVESLRAQGHDIGYLFPRVIWPMESSGIRKLLGSGITTLYVCEANQSQQYAQLIRANFAEELRVNRVDVVGVNQDNGSPFSARDIQQRLQERLAESAASIRRAV